MVRFIGAIRSVLCCLGANISRFKQKQRMCMEVLHNVNMRNFYECTD